MPDPPSSAESGVQESGEHGAAHNKPEQRLRDFIWFDPVGLYHYAAAQIRTQDGAKAKCDFVCQCIRGFFERLAACRWTRFGVYLLLVATLGLLLWRFAQGKPEAVQALCALLLAIVTSIQGWTLHAQLKHIRNEQRPWLAISNPNLYYASNDTEVKFEFDLTNHGKSPCTVRTAVYGVAFELDNETAKALAKAGLSKCSSNEGGALAPGATAEAVAILPSVTWTHEQLESMYRGELFITVTGKIVYGRDDTDRYETGFMFGTRSGREELIVTDGPVENYMR